MVDPSHSTYTLSLTCPSIFAPIPNPLQTSPKNRERVEILFPSAIEEGNLNYLMEALNSYGKETILPFGISYEDLILLASRCNQLDKIALEMGGLYCGVVDLSDDAKLSLKEMINKINPRERYAPPNDNGYHLPQYDLQLKGTLSYRLADAMRNNHHRHLSEIFNEVNDYADYDAAILARALSDEGLSSQVKTLILDSLSEERASYLTIQAASHLFLRTTQCLLDAGLKVKTTDERQWPVIKAFFTAANRCPETGRFFLQLFIENGLTDFRQWGSENSDILKAFYEIFPNIAKDLQLLAKL